MVIGLRFLRDRRRSMLWWTAAMLGVVLLNLAFYPSFKNQPSFDQLFENMPESVQKLLGSAGAPLTSPVGYLHSQVFTSVLPLVLLIFGIAIGARAIAGTEGEGSLELVLANPVTRLRLAVERYAALVAAIVALGVAGFIGLLLMSPLFGLLEGISIVRLLAACLAATALALLHASLAFGVGALSGSRAAAIASASGVAVAGYILFGITSAGVAQSLRFVSPWYWYLDRNILLQGIAAGAVVPALVLSAAAAVVGVLVFTRRDLR